MRMAHVVPALAALLALPSLVSCQQAEDRRGEENLGPIEETLDDVALTVWPGTVRTDGTRYVRRLNGFFDGEATSYWFVGFASRLTADVFLFCREGDEACPFTDKGVLDWSRLVGQPVFARVPGEEGYSPFWFAWVVHVPDDYQPNELKSVKGIEEATAEGRVKVERFIFDHGADVGPDETIMHCLLVLDGTELEGNGEDIVGQPGVESAFVDLNAGWHKQYVVKFYDFTPTEGVFSPDPASESRPVMRTSDIFVMFRDCDSGSGAEPCQVASAEQGAVSERGVESDLTHDGDKSDTNNVIMGFPGKLPANPADRPYSPLWRVNVVEVVPEREADVRLIDDTTDQFDTDITSLAEIRKMVEEGVLREPELMPEGMSGNSIPGNNGNVFFNCPSQVSAK